MRNTVQAGRVIPFTADANIVSGQVVRIGHILGVAAADVAMGASGLASIDGVFTVSKVPGAVIAAGESLTFVASSAAFDDNQAATSEGDVTGPPAVAFEAAGSGEVAVAVRFTGVPGAVA